MSPALPAPSVAVVFTSWTWQPVAAAAVLLLAAWYAHALRRVRRTGGRWPLRRSVSFALGLALTVWLTCGFAQVYAPVLYSVWTAQVLALWLLVPAVLLSGRPLSLARASGGGQLADRILDLPGLRTLHNPLVAPALVPLLSIVLFFGPLPAWATYSPAAGWLVQAVLVGLGTLMVVPLLDSATLAGSLAVGVSLAIGMFELVLDAVPGIVLRLHRGLVSGFFDQVGAASWLPDHLHDQQLAGTILWAVAELLDLPFVLIVFGLWVRADARDAAAMDAVLEAERVVRTALGPEPVAGDAEDGHGPSDAPWWLTDPTMLRRLHQEE